MTPVGQLYSICGPLAPLGVHTHTPRPPCTGPPSTSLTAAALSASPFEALPPLVDFLLLNYSQLLKFTMLSPSDVGLNCCAGFKLAVQPSMRPTAAQRAERRLVSLERMQSAAHRHTVVPALYLVHMPGGSAPGSELSHCRDSSQRSARGPCQQQPQAMQDIPAA